MTSNQNLKNIKVSKIPWKYLFMIVFLIKMINHILYIKMKKFWFNFFLNKTNIKKIKNNFNYKIKI